ncbi:energy transducer TonB [Hymenobacter sp. DG25B]|uniref:energy transducer TonB n=1 Tax=Hymenobacter sp. DG25B TaxID=1385664 RepID=UPI0006625DA0|nr:energy transducer TonB [Hymenobacter sp. DG25B]
MFAGAFEQCPGNTQQQTLFFAQLDSEAVDEQEAIYHVVRMEVPGKSRLDSVFFVASRKLLKVRKSLWQPNGDTLTETVQWRANGKKQFIRHEVGSKTHGEYLSFYDKGSVQKRALYDHDVEVSAECFSESGSSISCKEYKYSERMPEFPGGQRALLNFIGSTIRYPKAALKRHQEGKVYITFVIDETGKVRNAQVKQGISPELDAEALRIIKAIPAFKPGQQDGENVPVYMTVPITFAIR